MPVLMTNENRYAINDMTAIFYENHDNNDVTEMWSDSEE